MSDLKPPLYCPVGSSSESLCSPGNSGTSSGTRHDQVDEAVQTSFVIFTVNSPPADKDKYLVTVEPLAPKPVAFQPATPQLVTPQPVTPRPVNRQPVNRQPVNNQPVDRQPVTPAPAPVTPKNRNAMTPGPNGTRYGGCYGVPLVDRKPLTTPRAPKLRTASRQKERLDRQKRLQNFSID